MSIDEFKVYLAIHVCEKKGTKEAKNVTQNILFNQFCCCCKIHLIYNA